MLVDICWIYTEGHPGIFFFISLGSLVLFKDSKTMVRFFGGRNFELFQCSAEGCGAYLADLAKLGVADEQFGPRPKVPQCFKVLGFEKSQLLKESHG